MWKLLFLPLMVLSLAVIIRPPIIFSSQLTPDSDPVRYGKSNFSRTQCLKITKKKTQKSATKVHILPKKQF